MADNSGGPSWTETQWQTVNNAITEAFGKASTASAFLPCYGPLGPSTEAVRMERLTVGNTVQVNDEDTSKVFNLRVDVELSSQQVADESLSSALLAFKRAANTLARASDFVVFNGTPPSGKQLQAQARATTGPVFPGGVTTTAPSNPDTLLQTPPVTAPGPKGGGAGLPTNIVASVSTVVASLEANGHPGPFACVLGAEAFVAAHTPINSVMPVQQFEPILGGAVLRSSQVPPKVGVVVSLGSGAIDIVVATPPKAQFLQITNEARYLFRVYLRFVLRIKDPGNPPVAVFVL